jgi:hypothetical protein
MFWVEDYKHLFACAVEEEGASVTVFISVGILAGVLGSICSGFSYPQEICRRDSTSFGEDGLTFRVDIQTFGHKSL